MFLVECDDEVELVELVGVELLGDVCVVVVVGVGEGYDGGWVCVLFDVLVFGVGVLYFDGVCEIGVL